MTQILRCVVVAATISIGTAAIAKPAGDLVTAVQTAWSEVPAGSAAINNASQCTGGNFAALATALEGLLGPGATVGTGTWTGSPPNARCTFTVSIEGSAGAELVEVFRTFSPSGMAPARGNHIHGVVVTGGSLQYSVAVRGTPAEGSRLIAVADPIVAGGQEVEGCFTPSLEPFAGPSPCNPDHGHGRWSDEEAPLEPPARGRSGEAPGRNR